MTRAMENETNQMIAASLLAGLFLTLTILCLMKRVRSPKKQRKEAEKARLFAESISVAEYEEQKQNYTKKKVKELFASQEYQKMQAEKGDEVGKWNWQVRSNRPLEVI